MTLWGIMQFAFEMKKLLESVTSITRRHYKREITKIIQEV